MKAKLPLIIVIVVVVALVVIAIVLGGVGPKKAGEQGEGTEVTGIEQEIAGEIYGLSGTIKEINDNAIILDASIPLTDENAEPLNAMVKAVVTDNTKIVKLTFPEKIPANPEEPVYPEETEMSFDELKAGDEIHIGTIENVSEKIKNGQEFELSDIFIIE